MPKPEFAVGQLWDSRNPNHHGRAKHGIFEIVADHHGALYAVDTYWGAYTSSRWELSEIGSDIEFKIDTLQCRKSDRDEFDRYADADRAYIPIGGSSEIFYIRANATPDPDLVRQQRERVRDKLKSDISYAQQRLAEVERLLQGATA